MEQKKNMPAREAAADEHASPSRSWAEGADAAAPADPPAFDPPSLLSDSLDAALGDTIAATSPPGSRKPRHDGWTAEAITAFLRALAATGVVEHAARSAGRSVSSAYAFRNRRQGRAFACMWDAVLVHRTRARLASELQARAIAGCVSVRKRDGVVVGEYHYYDNRLAAALLTRLDRLAERETESDAHLRALSEDLDDYLECIAEGGDADAFVENRRPAEPEPEPAPEPPAPDDDREITLFAHLAGCPDYLDCDPYEIDVSDIDLNRKHEWTPDQWVRAFRSGFMIWLHLLEEEDPDFRPGPGEGLRFEVHKAAARAVREFPEELGEADLPQPDPADILEWTDLQLARARRSGLLEALPAKFWDEMVQSRPDRAAGEDGE